VTGGWIKLYNEGLYNMVLLTKYYSPNQTNANVLGQLCDANGKDKKYGKTPTEKLQKRPLGISKRRCDLNTKINIKYDTGCELVFLYYR
jgi:hypothetical protein